MVDFNHLTSRDNIINLRTPPTSSEPAESMKASGGNFRYLAITFLIVVHAAVCFPVGELSVQTPCDVLKFSTNANTRVGEWSRAEKSVVYALEDTDFDTGPNAADADVCKGTVSLHLGATSDVLVFKNHGSMQVCAGSPRLPTHPTPPTPSRCTCGTPASRL